MREYDYIAIVLVYRNADDLTECIKSFYHKVESCKIIVVNAYYDEDSRMKIEKIANDNDCDFINIENKGYSYGNNCGIRHAKDNYKFKYIIISNPDIIVKKFNKNFLENLMVKNRQYGAIAPKVVTLSGKNQNPMLVVDIKLAQFLVYKGIKKNNKFMFFMGIGINKVLREFTLMMIKVLRKKKIEIFTPHGCFVILTEDSINMLNPIYDENMFLFAEEGVLAHKLKQNKLHCCYTNEIEIFHKEDGSMKLSQFSLGDEMKKANIYFYENYYFNLKDINFF